MSWRRARRPDQPTLAPPAPAQDAHEAARRLKEAARGLGFVSAGIAPAVLGPEPARGLLRWLEAGRQGDMRWLEEDVAGRADARTLLPGARAVLVVALPHAPERRPRPDPAPPTGRGYVASYAAAGRDYHRVMGARLRELERFARELLPGEQARRFCDTAPLLERAFAQAAGLGFVGKNTCLIDPRRGSFLFLGGLALTAALPPDGPGIQGGASGPGIQGGASGPGIQGGASGPGIQGGASGPGIQGGASGPGDPLPGCGTCTRCLDACPTAAFPAPYELDARRCISYLTIEHKGSWPEPLRASAGTHLFGCDVCQSVCPWNKFSPPADPELAPEPERSEPQLLPLLGRAAGAFKKLAAGTPWERPGKRGFLRNLATALGNAGDPAARGELEALARHEDPAVAEHARWALGRLDQRPAGGGLGGVAGSASKLP